MRTKPLREVDVKIFIESEPAIFRDIRHNHLATFITRVELVIPG
jgi:hypothetical protein